MLKVKIKTGDINKKLRSLNRKLQPVQVQSGIFEDKTYSDGTSIAYIASVQEYGATINIPARKSKIFRKRNEDGSWMKESGSRFVKKSEANFITEVDIPSYTITIPPRPWLRSTISEQGNAWLDFIRNNLFKSGSLRTFNSLGVKMREDLKNTITSFDDPPNAPSTVRQKGFNDPLIWTGKARDSVTYKVEKIK